MKTSTLLLAGCIALLTACASDPANLAPGASRDQALNALGPPTARYPMPDGERLQYSRQPMGFQVYDADFDRSGKLLTVTQVLDEGFFQRAIQPGVWRTEDVQRTFGPPSVIERVGDFNGVVWTYNYLMMNSRRFLHIYIDPQGVVRRVHSTDDLRGPNRFRFG